jgi:hypothetical protein
MGEMTNPIPGYGVGLPKHLTLGYIAWYTITNPRVTHEQMVDLVTDLGLDTYILPNPPRRGDAFKRACRYSEQTGLNILGSDHKANILIRSVANTAAEVERHMVLEIVDAEGRHLEYIDAAHLKFDRANNKLHVMKRQLETSYDSMVMKAINIFQQNFEDAAKYIDAQVIRRMIRDQLSRIGAIGVRRQGSVYFYPAKHESIGLALEKFCTHMGAGSDFHSLPLVDTKKQREMVVNAFEEEVHERAVQIMTELEQYRHSEKKITIRAWSEYRQELARLQDNATAYKALVDNELTKAEVELTGLQGSLENFLGSGMVKT